MWTRDRILKVLLAVLGVLTCTAPALAGGGNVLPPSATPRAYSLSEIAVATAVYNTGVNVGLSPSPPNVPFEVLVPDTLHVTVKPGTMLYLPIFFSDDSDTVAPGFPADIADQQAAADFLNSYVLMNFGVTDFIVQVDGQTTILDDDYIVGVTTAPLPDGPPAGTHYIVSAAFLTPLTPGTHTVGLGGIIGGEPVVFVSYNVTVR